MIAVAVWSVTTFLHANLTPEQQEQRRTPHDIASGKGEDEIASPDSLIIAFGCEEVCEEASDNDKDEADDDAGTGITLVSGALEQVFLENMQNQRTRSP